MHRTAPGKVLHNPPISLLVGAVLAIAALVAFFFGAPLIAYLSVGLLLLCPLLLLKGPGRTRTRSELSEREEATE
jgi:hypothetical protein